MILATPAFPPELRDLRVRLPEFAEIASAWVDRLQLAKTGGRGPKADAASERAIRDYVRRQVLSPTLKDPATGERGLYGFKHLIQFLAARALLNREWTLDQIVERFQSSTIDDLLTLLPAEPEPQAGDVGQLIAAFRAEASRRGAGGGNLHRTLEGRPVSIARSIAPSGPSSLPDRRHDEAIRRQVAIQVEPGVALTIDEARVNRLTPSDAERIGRLLTATLKSLMNIAGRDPTP